MEDNRNNRRPGEGNRNSARRPQQQASRNVAPNGNRRPQQQGRPTQSRPQQVRNGQGRPTQSRPQQSGNRSVNHGKAPLTQKQLQRKKRNKILLFIAEIFILLILLVVFWGVSKVKKINVVEFSDDEVEINEEILKETESGAMKGYRNIAIFGVDSRDQQLDTATRTDTIMIASINEDTGEVKLVSIYRDTLLNLSTDTYNKANSAYAKGGPKQAIAMLNMNLDMNITDFVTVGFDGAIDLIDAVGGIEIDVKEAEISHLNNYQISMVGKQDGVNAAGEPNYVATAGVDYEPVTKAGLQTLNGLQATAYMRIRYVGNDFGRTQRQRTVIEKVVKKALTFNPSTINKMAEAIFPKIATSLQLSEIIELAGGIAKYSMGENAGFPFDGHYYSGKIGKKGSCIVPTTLEENVTLLHEFFFGKENYEPTETVKKCSQEIQSQTASYIK